MSLVFAFSRPAVSQPVLDPNYLEFTASADHDGVGTGTGNGTVTFNVARNTGSQTRSTSATVAGRTVTLSQRVATAPAPPNGMRIVK